MVSIAQVRMLSEGLAQPLPACDPMPAELAPKISFTNEQIRKGLPPAGQFGLRDLRCWPDATARKNPHKTIVFLEMP
jgi:LPS sulfotransferase NodH